MANRNHDEVAVRFPDGMTEEQMAALWQEYLESLSPEERAEAEKHPPRKLVN